MKEKNYEYKDLNTKLICIDKLYQREVDMSRVRKMNAEYRPELVNAIKVSMRDGKYWCFDGRHTAELLKMRNGGKDCLVECKVFYGLTWLDECELFLLQNGLSRSVDMADKFKARFNRGDADVVKMVELAQDCGVRVDFSKTKGENRICALTTLNKIFNALGDDDYKALLSLIHDTWGGDAVSYSSEMLKGMYVFYTTYKGQFNRARFVKACGKTSASVIIREGKASTAPGFAKYARQIWNFYNYGTKNRLPDLL